MRVLYGEKHSMTCQPGSIQYSRVTRRTYVRTDGRTDVIAAAFTALCLATCADGNWTNAFNGRSYQATGSHLNSHVYDTCSAARTHLISELSATSKPYSCDICVSSHSCSRSAVVSFPWNISVTEWTFISGISPSQKPTVYVSITPIHIPLGI